jgi:glucose/mannose-6-phosphate isomerase
LSVSEALVSYDTLNIIKTYSRWPSFARETLNVPLMGPKGAFDSCVLVGMGGSGIVGEVISDLAATSGRVPVSVLKDYHLPRFVNRNTLVVCISASGDTEETVSAFYEARERGSITVAISANGKLAEIAERKGALFYKTRIVHSPRASLVFMLLTAVKILKLASILQMPDEELSGCSDVLEAESTKLLKPEDETNPSVGLAKYLLHGFPLIYSTPKFRAVGMRFRQSLNENAKIHALDLALPELCHNDIVAWEGGDNEAAVVKPVLLSSEEDPEEYKVRMSAIQEVIEGKGLSIFKVVTPENRELPQILGLIYELDIASIYLAVLRGVDPSPTRPIDFLKSKLNAKLNYLSRFESVGMKRR